MPDAAHDVLRHAAQPAELGVGEAVPLGPGEQVAVELERVAHLGGHLVDQLHLVDEPRVDAGGLVHLLDRGAGPERLLHVTEPPVVRHAPRAPATPLRRPSLGSQLNGAPGDSSERSAFCSASVKLRPIAIASPTDFMWVVSTGSAPGNFSNANRGTLTTT